MLDWSKTFNIIFVAVASALMVFLFVSVIAVVAKGKRKRNAFDIILRLISALVFIASVGLMFAAVLTMMSGGFCILVADGAASLVVGEAATELPMPDLFVLLSTPIGAIIAFGLFILSLIAIIADCKLAVGKKKKQKAQKAKTVKSKEQLKREAELERIKRIGNAAVQKTSTAAETHSQSSEEKQSITEKSEPDFDWRKTDAPAKSEEFVGISKNTDDDSFDDFGEIIDDNEPSSESEDIVTSSTVTEENTVTEEDNTQSESLDEFLREMLPETDNEKIAVQAEESEAEEYETENVESVIEDTEGNIQDEQTDEEVTEEEYIEDETAYDEAEEADEISDSKESYEEETAETYEHTESSTDSTNEATYADDYADVEPDRRIYIPKVRTIVKQKTVRSSTTKKVEQSKAKPKSTSTAAPKKNTAKTQSASANKPKKATEPNRKLPVTKRYVILDRRNAVNMFGDYLKERDAREKGKLESSINTIIIK